MRRPAPAAQLTRYSVVNRCYMLRTGSGQTLGPFRMQATALGQYLLYGVHGDFLAAGLTSASTPGSNTVWQLDGGGASVTITNLSSGAKVPVSFSAASAAGLR